MSEVKKLYNALLSKGYTTQDLGDENTFTTKMSDANNRKELYDWVSSRGDFRLGKYEDYEKRLYTPIQQRDNTPMADRYSVAPEPSRAEELMPKIEEAPKEEKPKVRTQMTYSSPHFNPISYTSSTEKVKEQPQTLTPEQQEAMKAQRQQLSDMTSSVQQSLDRRGAELDEIARQTPGAFVARGTAGSIAGFDAGRMYDAEYRDYAAAKESLDKAQDMINAADKEAEDREQGRTGFGGFWRGAGRGAKDAALDWNTWSMGLKDTSEGHALLKALDAAEDGTLTPSQQTLLDAKAIELATAHAYESQLGRGYKAGKGVTESLPFMMEFAFNPIAGAGKTAANRIAHYALNRFGKEAVKKNAGKYLATQAATRVGTDLLKAGAMAATTGAGRTTADALRRMQGDIYYQTNEDGKTEYWKRENAMNAGEAFKKAYLNTTLENFSEFLGNYFAPIGKASSEGLVKGLNKIGLNKVNDFIENVKASDIAKLVSDFENKAQWNGTIGEFAEEVSNGILNSIFVGDQTRDTDENTGVFNRDNLIDTFIQTSLIGGGVSAAKTIGYPIAKYNAKRNYEREKANFEEHFGTTDQPTFYWDGKKIPMGEALASSDARIVGGALRDIVGNEDYPIKHQMTALKYAGAAKKYKGAEVMTEKRKADPEIPIEQVNVEESYENGRNISTPEEKNEAKTNLDVAAEEMRRVFGLNTDEDIDEYIGNDIYGFVQQKRDENPDDGQVVLNYINAKAEMDGLYDRINDDIDRQVEQSNRIIDSRKSNDDGMIHPATLSVNDRKVYIISGNVARRDDGTIDTTNSTKDGIIVMDAETGKTEFVDAKDFREVADAIDAEQEKANAAELIANTISEREEKEIDGTLAFASNDTYTILDNEGAEHNIVVVGDNGDGTINAIVDSNEKPQVMAKADVQAMSDNAKKARKTAEIEAKRASNKVVESSRNEAVAEPTANVEQAPERVVPKLKNGQPDFNAMDADMFVQEYASRYGEESTAKLARKNIDAAREEIAKIDKKIDDITDPNQMQGLFDKKAEAEARLNRYVDILDRMGMSEDANETEADQKSKLRNEAGNKIVSLFPDGLPNVESFILADIATGNRIRWSDKETNGAVTSRGLGSELGLSGSNKERVKRLALISNDAMTPEEYAESLRERLDAAGIRYDETALRDDVINTYASVDTRKSAWEALENIANRANEQYQELMDWEDAQQRIAYEKAKNAVELPAAPDLATIEEEVPVELGASFYENINEIENIFNDERSTENTDVPTSVSAEDGIADGDQTSIEVVQGAGVDSTLGDRGSIEAGQGSNEGDERVRPETISSTDVYRGAEVDNQGNPINLDGSLKLEKVESIDDMTDEDFENPYRNIELPTLPENVADAIGSKGKSVVIKKNIFERNIIRHSDLTPDQSRDILKSALYSPNLYGQNQKKHKPYNWVVVSTKDANGQNKLVLLEISDRKNNIEIVHWHYVDARGLEKLKRQAEREDGQLLILPSESTEEVGALSDPTLSMPSENKDTTSEPQKQDVEQKNVVHEQEADISDEDIEALWIKSRDELWKPDDETGQILHEKLYEAHPEEHQPEDRKKVVRHLIEAAEKYKDHPIAKEVLKYVKYPQTTSMRVSPLANREEMRRKPLRARAKMWEAKVGVPVHLVETFEEVPTKDARKAILDGKVVTAWVTDGEVYLYMPYLRNRTEVDKTYIHEVVAHVGMKRLLGKEGYRQFCMRVYNEVMTEADRKSYDAYPNVKDHAQAADEYIAHLSETTDLESSVWQKVVRIFRDALRVLGIETALTNKDIQDMLRDSYKNLTNEENVSISESEGTQLRSVYHGSGAEFDKFDHSFMGTGEGNQSFGWGTYVTEDENKARVYAQIHPLFYNKRLELSKLRREQSKLSENIPFLKGKALKKATRELEKIKKALTSLSNEANRYLYSVEIPDNDGTNYLEYGKPLSKTQLDSIKQALYNRLAASTYKGAEQELKEELNDVFAIEKELDGGDIYGTIGTYLGSDKAASQFLNENGYVGISYPADGGNAGKARNYVIFNESDLEIKDSTRFRVKEKAPETASVQKEHQPTVVSSADGTKVLKKIDSAIGEYENKSNYPRTLLGDIAKVLNARKQGSNSQYATFEAKNGKVFTIRLADHNAKVSTFDIHNEKDGISIIITAKSNEGIQNDGDAHIVEYFYDSIKLRKADGKPLVEILKSIKQALYSGEYKDTTGLAEREEVNIRDGVRFRVVEPAPTFYSNAERAAENVKQEKATPEQWLKMIEKNGGLKAGEDKWLGLSDWLKSSDKKTLTKQEVLDFIKENQIQIEEVEYGDLEDSMRFKELQKEYRDLYYEKDRHGDLAFGEMIRRYGDDFDLAFAFAGDYLIIDDLYGTESAEAFLDANPINSTRLDYTTNGLDNKHEIALTVPTIESWNESDEIHFGDAGNGRAIAWVRFGETTDADGNRVLVIDEVQSKRHQEGRERGYAKTEANDAFVAYRDQMMDKYGIEDIGSIYGVLNTEDKIEFDKLRTAANVEFRNSSDVPSAPFEKNWAELAMKRMLRYAAENGFDKIAWTTGEQQAERYDISKSVDNIKSEDNNVEETADGTLIVKNITIYAGGSVHNLFVDANGIVRGREYDGKKLSDIVGKPLAEKLMEQGDFELEGDGLRIGGEGMKAFYDQMIPSFMNKYGKKWGVKVGEVTMPSLEENNTMHSIDVTDAMRESVMQGQPMFRISDYDRQFADLQSEYDALDKNDAKALNEWREKKAAVLQSYMDEVTEEFNLPVKESYVYDPTNEDDIKRIYDAYVAALDRRGITSPIEPYEEFNAELQELDAAYREDADIIVANRNSMENSEQDVFEAIMHEQTHGVVSRIISTRALRDVWEEGKAKKPEFASVIENEYKGEGEARWGDEFLTYYLVRTLFSPRVRAKAEAYIKGESKITAEKFVKHTQDLLPLTNDALKQILNFYKDEYQKKTIHGFRSESSRGSEEIRGGIQRRVVSNARTERERRGADRGFRGRVLESANALAASLGVKLNVVDAIPNAPKGVKGRYSISTDQVYFVLPNATSVEDAKRTVLHEVVAHKGLRDVVGRERFNKFLDKVFQATTLDVRSKIIELAKNNSWNVRVATEEYLASLAEKGFDGRENRTFWEKVRDLFMDMLREAKIILGFNINDNDMLYMLWRTYQMQKSQGIMAVAEDVVMQRKLGVGRFRFQDTNSLFRVTPNEREQIIADAKANGTYLKAPNGKDTNLTPEQWVTVRTDAFKKWFGDWENDPANASKVVDANGEPKVVYHRTPNEFTIFDTEKIGSSTDWGAFGMGFYFSPNSEQYGLYGSNEMALFLNARNPLMLDDSNAYDVKEPFFKDGSWNKEASEEFTKWVKDNGYDAVVYKTDFNEEDIAFSPNQIKSAEGNTTFDANNDDIRFRVAPSTPVSNEAKGVRESFDQMVKSKAYQMKEAAYDRQQSIKEYMRLASKAHGVELEDNDVKNIASYENPYIAMINKSSINEKEIKAWEKKFYIPILNATKKIRDASKDKIDSLKGIFGAESIDDIFNNYLQGKHGLERNRDMAVKASLEKMAKETLISKEKADEMLERVNEELRDDIITPTQADAHRQQISNMLNTKKNTKEQVKYQTEVWEQRKKAIKEDKTLDTWRKKQEALDKVAITEFGVDLAERDYSGLGEVFSDKKKKKNLKQSIEQAYEAVEAFEDAFDTKELWDAINAATESTLEIALQSSVISRDTFEKIRSMYDYYIPLRGFEADTTEDVYGYLNNETKAFSMPVKRANGRASKAEFAIPHILQMAQSAILQGNNNRAKLAFANFAQHYSTDLVKQSNMWIEYDETEKVWKAKFPEGIDKNTPIDEVTRIVDEFNANMEQNAKENPDKYRKVKGKMDVPYIVQKKDENDHQIRYKRNGVDYILTVNGSPRLAYAMNGAIDQMTNKLAGDVGEKVEGFTRYLSGMYTQYNPDFMVSNFFRDASFVLSTVWVRENPKYAAKFYKNYALSNPIVMTRLFAKYENRTLDRNKPLEAAFEDFIKNGGETGYAILKDVEQTKKRVAKDINRNLWGKVMALVDRLGVVGRGVESSARFAAYLTSREAGRSISRSVYDAKEVSVNFNRKGAGAAFNDLADQTKMGKMAGATAGIFKISHAFFNAGVQGLAGISKLVKYHPVKGSALLVAPMLLGWIIASLFDDDDEYYNLSETVRRQNIIIPMGNDYISIPLAIELRAMYGLGEMMVSLTRGREDLTQKNVAYKIAEQILQAFPINVLEGNGGFDALLPTAVSIVTEVMLNEDWQGMPIYREDKYEGDEYIPEWEMVSGYTDNRLVAASKFLSEAAGGDYGKRGKFEIPILGNVAEINPAVVQHIMEGMFGGPMSFFNKVTATYDTAFGDKDFEWRNVPFLNRVVKDGGGKAQERTLNNEYRNNVEKYEALHKQELRYEEFIRDESNSLEERAEYKRKLDELRVSEEYKKMAEFNEASKWIDKMYKQFSDVGTLDENMSLILEEKEKANAPLREVK